MIKQLDTYKKAVLSFQQQNKNLLLEKQQIVHQLQSLFSLYNKQKETIEQITRDKAESDRICQTWKERNQTLQHENDILKIGQSKEMEVISAKHKLMFEETERRISELQTKLSRTEDEKHRLMISETDYKDQVKEKEKKIVEMEYSLESMKSKMEHEIVLITRQKEQLNHENNSLQKKLAVEQREEDKRIENEREIRKELARLTYVNEELSDELQRWKKKYNTVSITSQANIQKPLDANDMNSSNRLAVIESKLESILKNQNQSEHEAEQKESQDDEDEESMEGMLKNLTVQILEKDEVKNANIIKMFKLDKIQLDDKEKEYKSLLKAMAALYFANRYGKIVPVLFECWKTKIQEKLNGQIEGIQEQEDEAEMQEHTSNIENDL